MRRNRGFSTKLYEYGYGYVLETVLISSTE